MGNNPKRKYIRRVRDNDLALGRFQHLRSYISRGSALLIQQLLFPYPAGQAEICDHIILGLILVKPHHYILEFEVAMDDPLLAQMLKPQGDVPNGLQLIGIVLQGILPEQSTTFLSYSSRVPPSKY